MKNLNSDNPELSAQFHLLVEEVKEYAIFQLDPDGYIRSWNKGAERIKGYSEDEILGQHFSIFYSEEARQSGRPETGLKNAEKEGQWTDEGWRVRKDGSRFWAQVTITALSGDSGDLRGFVKVTHDLTDRKQREEELTAQKRRAEREKQKAKRESTLLRLMEKVAAMANETESLEIALEEATGAICKHTGWPVGHVYWLRPGGERPLVSSGIWQLPGDGRFETFHSVTEAANFDVGESLPGRVADLGEPVWIEDVTEDLNFVHKKMHSGDLGVRGAFAVPVQVEGKTVAVLEFFSSERKERDERLMEAIESVGVQLSRVAEREEARAALEESEEKFRALAEQSLIGIELIQDGVYKYVNPIFAGYFGYSQEELIGRSPKTVFHPDDWPEVERKIERRLTGEKDEAQFTARGQTRDGETVHLQVYGQRINYQGRPAIVGASLDVTERRELQQEVLQIQEEERRRIGQDLHDGIASQLTGVNLMLSNLSRRFEANGLDEQIEEVQALVKESAGEVRRLSRGLSPSGLSRGDLHTALEELAHNTGDVHFELGSFQEENEGPDLDVSDLEENEATHLYRIAQEAVANARKYAEATAIEIRVRCEDGSLLLEIEDDGRGFDPEETNEGLGLRSMRRRADLLGAELTVETSPCEGTLIRCRLPR